MNACRLILAAIAAGVLSAFPAVAACPGRFAVEILGSGGPIADDDRAASSYLVWTKGEARLLVDAGGGAFLRYGEAGAAFEDLDAILISHFDADHAGDLPEILKSGSFSKRTDPLLIAGPSGNAYFPGLAAFMKALFDPDAGAFRYLGALYSGSGGRPALTLAEIDAEGGLQPVRDDGEIRVEAIAVNHGDVPALAYKVSAAGEAAIFAGDQSLFSEAFEAAFEGDAPALLIAHHAISEARGQPRGLHRSPSSIGEMAQAIGARELVLSHNMARALEARREGLAAIRKAYSGKVSIADDGACRTIVR